MSRESSNPHDSFTVNPASPLTRILAFAMDFVLLVFLSMLMMFYLPKLMGAQTEGEFENLSARFVELVESGQPNPDQRDRLMEDVISFKHKIHYDFAVSFAFILYFVLAEFIWNGKTIGKATFSLKTHNAIQPSPSSNQDPQAPSLTISPRQMLIRSLLKGLSCSFGLLGLINLLFYLFNKQKKSLHDLASGTVTVQFLTRDSQSEPKPE